MRPHDAHRKASAGHLKVQVCTVSTSRFAKMRGGEEYSDEAGDEAERMMVKSGHRVTRRELISDDVKMLRKAVRRFLSGRDDVLLFTGGTGVSKRDVTIETVRPFFEKELDGFGELLRRISYEEVGGAATLTRATAGVARGKLIACMPGSPGAVRTAMQAFGEEIPHAIFIARS